MSNESNKLIADLANKLGTTTEYLWGVLLRQASIDATVTLIQVIIIALMGFFLYRLHLKFIRPIPDDEYNDNLYEKYDGSIPVALLIAFIWIVFATAAFFSFGNIVYGYFNPEYWALEQILNTISGSN